MEVGTGTTYFYAYCPREDADAAPLDFQTVERSDFLDRYTRACFFMLERDNRRRTTKNVLRMRQRLFSEGSHIVAYETGERVTVVPSSININILSVALFLRRVLASYKYSHLTKIPICMFYQIEIRWTRWTEQLELAAALQESMNHTDFGAVPATREAIDVLEKIKPVKGSSEGEAAEPCSICLEEKDAHDAEAACMPCKHVFHYDCIARWLYTSHLCPLCRFPLPTDHVSRSKAAS